MDNGILMQSANESSKGISSVNDCWQALLASALIVVLLFAAHRVLERRISADGIGVIQVSQAAVGQSVHIIWERIHE